ncbi:MAG: hypothetical protein LUQ18_01545 [Methylococcaceae bacterium]|nr:hypothetical protein [Methylococcaceae bacterium]
MLITELENELTSSSENWRAWTWRKQRQLPSKATPTQAVPIGNSGEQY